MWEYVSFIVAVLYAACASRAGLTDQARRHRWLLANLWLVASIILGEIK